VSLDTTRAAGVIPLEQLRPSPGGPVGDGIGGCDVGAEATCKENRAEISARAIPSSISSTVRALGPRDSADERWRFTSDAVRPGIPWRRLIAAAVLALGFILGAHAQRAHADHATLSGAITLNGSTAPPNVQINVRSPEAMSCGTFTTDEDGLYILLVSEECPTGTSLIFVLAQTGDQAPVAATIDGGDQQIDIAFEGLTPEDLQALGIEEPSTDVVQVPSEPLSGGDLWSVIIGTVLLPMSLLVIMVIRTRHDDNGVRHESTVSPFRNQIEGMVLVMVVLAVILLGVTDKIGSDGLVSVLAAIVGYTLGRQLGQGTNGPSPSTPSSGTVGLSPSGADFGTHPPGGISGTKDFTVANGTAQTAQIAEVTLEGDPGFELIKAAPDESRRWWIGLPLDLGAGEEVVIRTRWTVPVDASAGSAASAVLRVMHTAPGAAPTAKLAGRVEGSSLPVDDADGGGPGSAEDALIDDQELNG
jgi:hypothetical protein